MDLRPTEAQEILRVNARDFLSREVTGERVRAVEAQGDYDRELWDQAVSLGWNSLIVSEEHGGQAMTLLDAAVIIEEVCRAAVLIPLASTLAGAWTLQRFGSDDLKRQVLPRLNNGLTMTLAVAESRGAPSEAVPAVYAGDTLSGTRYFVQYGAAPGVHLVAATRDGEPGWALVDNDQPAVTATREDVIGGIPSATVEYQDAAVLGWIGGTEALDVAQDLARSLSAFEAYAYAQKCLDLTADYVKVREQFGQAIGAFQAVQMRCADMAIILTASRFLANELLWKWDAEQPTPREVALVKGITAKMAPQVAQDSHLLHGGIGFIVDYDLYLYSRRAKEASLRWGALREAINTIAEGDLGPLRVA